MPNVNQKSHDATRCSRTKSATEQSRIYRKTAKNSGNDTPHSPPTSDRVVLPLALAVEAALRQTG